MRRLGVAALVAQVASLAAALSRRGAILDALTVASVPTRREADAWTPTALPLLSIAAAAKSPGPLPFARYPDPVLRYADAARVEVFDDDLRVVIGKLAAAAEARGASGLAATQCGVDARVVLSGGTAYVNPAIVARSPEGEMVAWREACLALPPDVAVETLRDRSLDVRARDGYGRAFRRRLAGADARQFAHEFDHARGVLVVDHALEPPSSRLYPAMASVEAINHAGRVAVAWARPPPPGD